MCAVVFGVETLIVPSPSLDGDWDVVHLDHILDCEEPLEMLAEALTTASVCSSSSALVDVELDPCPATIDGQDLDAIEANIAVVGLVEIDQSDPFTETERRRRPEQTRTGGSAAARIQVRSLHRPLCFARRSIRRGRTWVDRIAVQQGRVLEQRSIASS